jgi:DNA-binding MarR family transcriptional regulator
VADRLHSAAIHLLRRLRIEDDRTGLTGPRLSALSVLVFGGPMTLGGLAAAEQVSPPSMVRLVSALERKGLAVRESAQQDARVTIVRATPRGVLLLQDGRARRVARLEAVLRELSPRDLKRLRDASDVLETVLRDLATANRAGMDRTRRVVG